MKYQIKIGNLDSGPIAFVLHGIEAATPENALAIAKRWLAEVRTPARTGHQRPNASASYAGYILSSLDLFAALHRAGVNLNPSAGETGCGEVYPDALWKAFSSSLPPKKTTEGGAIRRELLSLVGVIGVPSDATHDQLDAAIAAVAAAARPAPSSKRCCAGIRRPAGLSSQRGIPRPWS